MFKMKNITVLVLIVSLISLSQLSCVKTATKSEIENKYSLFTPLSTEYPAVNNPKLAWTYHWPEDYDKVLEAMTAPCADKNGNCYFIGANYYLYSLNPSGEVKWNKKDFYGNLTSRKLPITEEGILAESHGSLNLVSFDGDIVWEIDESILGYFLSPNGTLFCNTYDDKIFGLDSNGKIMWSTESVKNSLLGGVFFDSDSNAYFLFTYCYFEERENRGCCIVSISPTGEKRWQKILPYDSYNLINEFLPNNTIQDTFLLAFFTEAHPETDEEIENRYENNNKSEKIIEAYNTDGEKIWEISNTKMGMYNNKYAVDQANKFYTVFNERDVNFMSAPLIKSYLSCFSKEGTRVWE